MRKESTMHSLNKFAYVNVWQFCIDILFLILSFAAAFLTASLITELYPVTEYFWVLIVYIPIWIFTMSTLGMYNRTTFNYPDRIFRHVALATLVSGLVIAFIFFYTKNIFFSRTLYSLYLVYTVIFLLADRYTILAVLKAKHGDNAKKALVIGTQELIDKFEYYLKKTQIQMSIIGYMSIDEAVPLKSKHCPGRLFQLADIIKSNVVDEVILAIPERYLEEARKYVLACEEMGITVRIVLDLYNMKISRTYFTSLGTLPMITFHSVCLNDAQLMIKRIVDIAGALVGLVITGLVSIFVIPAIKMDSPGPVFFRQARVGLNGRVFTLYKFRSMTCDAEERKQELLEQNCMSGGLMFKVRKDPRVTRVGRILRRTSIDELPQFWNVLKGDMSLVGTRPPTLDEVSRYMNGHRRRISIKPGLTGLWQVSGRSSIIDFDEVVRLDTAYIDKWSVLQDIKIILRTIPAIVIRKGAM